MPTRDVAPLRRVLISLIAAGCAGLWATRATAQATHRFAIGDEDFLLDGRPLQIRCGEIHFARIPREYWVHRLRLCKAMGLNTVCAYLFWNFHQWDPGRFDWSGQADAGQFCRLAQQEGLWVILRPGPYACAEWEGGGLPWWLLKKEKESECEAADPDFLAAGQQLAQGGRRVLGPMQITRGGPSLWFRSKRVRLSGDDVQYMARCARPPSRRRFIPPCSVQSAVRPSQGPRNDLFNVSTSEDPATVSSPARNPAQGP
jgi:beta-galactosidase